MSLIPNELQSILLTGLEKAKAEGLLSESLIREAIEVISLKHGKSWQWDRHWAAHTYYCYHQNFQKALLAVHKWLDFRGSLGKLRILDIGCGAGASSLGAIVACLERGIVVEVRGVDSSQAMVDFYKDTLEKWAKSRPEVDICVQFGTAQAMLNDDLEDWDLVLCCYLFCGDKTLSVNNRNLNRILNIDYKAGTTHVMFSGKHFVYHFDPKKDLPSLFFDKLNFKIKPQSSFPKLISFWRASLQDSTRQILKPVKSIFRRIFQTFISPSKHKPLIESQLRQAIMKKSAQEFWSWLRHFEVSDSLIAQLAALKNDKCIESDTLFLEKLLEIQDSGQSLPFQAFSRNALEAEIKASEAIFSQLVMNKSLVITGPASYVVGSCWGSEIDSADLVVRINLQWPIPLEMRADLGVRAEILYLAGTSMHSPDELLSDPEFSKLRFVWMGRYMHSRRIADACRIHGIPFGYLDNHIQSLLNEIGTFPTTGFCAMTHLLGFRIKRLSLRGISFFLTPYYSSYKATGNQDVFWQNGQPSRIGSHDVGKHLKAFRAHWLNDPRLDIDPVVRSKIL